MANNEDEDFYLSLSKKELQCLCKNYGLSPFKTKSNLAKSLVSYFKKKNLSLISSGERLSGSKEAFLPTSSTPQLLLGAQLNSTREARKDSYGIISHLREEVRKGNYSQAVDCNKSGSCIDAETYNQASGEGKVDHLPQMKCRDINFGACPVKNASASSMKPSTEVPSSSLEFYVRSEEGIKLYVDLNSSPSDYWTTTLNNEVHICQNLQSNKPCGLHQELRCFGDINKQANQSSHWNTDSGHEVNEGHVETRSSPSSVMKENGHLWFDHLGEGDGSLGSSPIKPYSTAVDMQGHLEQDCELFLSSKPCSDVQDQMISGIESYPRHEGKLTLDSDVSDTSQIKSACDSAVNLTSDGTKSFDRLEIQNSKFSKGNCDKSTLQMTCSLVNPSVDSAVNLTSDGTKSFDRLEIQNSKFSKGNCEKSTLQMTCSLVNPSVVYPGCSASGSMEMQLSDIASHCKDVLRPPENGGFLDMVDPMHNVEKEFGGLTNSSKLNHDTCGEIVPTSAEEWERSDDLINQSENSECSQFNNSTEKICLRSDDLESSEGLQKKRECSGGQDNDGYGKPDAKSFKTMKHHTNEILPRRSMRLVYK